MADKTEIEKTLDSYERRLKEQEMLYQRERDQLAIHYKQILDMHEEQRKELLAQNDGMLGAIGRLHAENEALKKRVADLEPALARAKEDVVRTQKEADHNVEFAKVGLAEIAANIKREAKREIDQLKVKLAQAQARKKKS